MALNCFIFLCLDISERAGRTLLFPHETAFFCFLNVHLVDRRFVADFCTADEGSV
jgi:hypothetical protein